jgi:hypothetical protein
MLQKIICDMHPSVLILLLLISARLSAQPAIATLQAPGRDQYSQIDPAGRSVLPSGRFVTPVGKTLRITRAPYGLALSPDGHQGLVLHHSRVVTVLDLPEAERAVRVPDYEGEIPALNNAAFIGAAYTPDGKIVCLSGGDQGNVRWT